MAFQVVCPAFSLKVGESKKFQVGAKPVLLYRIASGFFATTPTCCHNGGDLSCGKVNGNRVVCPDHNWQFDVRTGACAKFPTYILDTFPVRLRMGQVEVDVDAQPGSLPRAM